MRVRKGSQYMVSFPDGWEEKLKKAATRKGLSIPMYIRTTMIGLLAEM